MALVTDSDVISWCSLPTELSGKLTNHIEKASRLFESLVGTTKYTALSALQGTDPDRKRADHAESLLSCYFALPFLNLRFTTSGGLVKAVGFDQSRTEIMNKREMEGYRRMYYKQAMQLIDDWVLPDQDSDGNDTNFLGGGISFEVI
ncbi:MAG TPA: hypothetical protein ENJ29_11935 [Bacteroidetes bacterium]|nr:hypothetical protein [Bacteroidota bacterium]